MTLKVDVECNDAKKRRPSVDTPTDGVASSTPTLFGVAFFNRRSTLTTPLASK
jgi:hypothetical protein